jgi:hypothetical protein
MEIFMKKLALLLAFLVFLAVGAFAEHPGGWGIGIVGQSHFNWGFAGYPGAALSLKVPQQPIFWGISAGIDTKNDFFGVNVTGDYYLVDQRLTNDFNFGWYLGIGVYAGLQLGGDNGLGVGARVPIGIYILPVPFFEIFLDVAPSLGINFGTASGLKFPAGGPGADIGIRFWL